MNIYKPEGSLIATAKNYEYIKEVRKDLEYNIALETDEKIAKVYDETTKNFTSDTGLYYPYDAYMNFQESEDKDYGRITWQNKRTCQKGKRNRSYRRGAGRTR